MTCSDVEKILPDIIDSGGDTEFQSHLKSCPACSELAAELKLIASEAAQLAETDEPPARVWVGIANQLRAEGIIREPEAVPGRPVLVPTRPRRWNAWWLAPVAAAILAAGAYQLTHQHGAAPVAQVAPQPVTQPHVAQPVVNPPAAQSAELAQTSPKAPPSGNGPAQAAQSRTLPPTKSKPAQPKQESSTLAENQAAQAEVAAPTSNEDQRFLSEVSQRAPGMRSTYENQLRAVNVEIQQTQAYIKRHPGDLDARQHLMEVFQQKAMLYQMALDRIQ